MGLSQYTPIAMSMLNFNIDGDLDMGAFKIKVNHIGESTAAHGVVINNALTASAGLITDSIGENTAAHGVVINNVLKVDHIAENTAGHNVVIDNLLVCNIGLWSMNVYLDHLHEYTAAHNIMFDNIPDLTAGIDFGNEARKKIMAYGGGF